MPNSKWREYRGYRIEASQRDANGWRLVVYRLKPELPAPLRPSNVTFESAASAMSAGRKDVDWILDRRVFG
jgi:hypothetical protein